MNYDLIVIGSGPGGYVAAIRASQLGLKTAIVEKESLGGICLNWGCIPTKALLKSAEVFEYINHAADYGIKVGSSEIDFESVIKRSRNVAEGMSKGVQFLMRKNKIDELPQLWNVVVGEMSLVGPRPQVPRFVERFPTAQRALIMMVRPGITGPTQLEFRHEERMLKGQENREAFYIKHLLPIKCEMDVHYVYSRCFLLDIRVLANTGSIVLLSILRRMLGINGTAADEDAPIAIPSVQAVVGNEPEMSHVSRRPHGSPRFISGLKQQQFDDPPFLDEKTEEITARSGR